MKIKKDLANVFVYLLVIAFLTISFLATLVQASAFEKELNPSRSHNTSSLTSDIAQWFYVLGDTNYQHARDVIQTNDGNLIFVGFTIINNDGDGWIAKYNTNGELIWQKTIGTENEDFFGSVKETSDGNLVVTGYSYPDGWIVKLDTDGNLIWQQGYTNTRYRDIEETNDGGFIVLGWTPARIGDVVVVKTNSLGVVEWQRTYGTGSTDSANNIIQTSDNGYVVVGELGGAWVLSLNNDGTIKWQKSFRETGIGSSATSVIELSDNSLIVAGYVKPDSADKSAWIAKIDSDGTVIWQKIFTDLGQSYFRTLQQTMDGGFILAGNYYVDGLSQALIIKLNNVGIIEWQKGIKVGPHDDGIYAIQQTTDTGYVAAGYTFNNSFDNDIWLTKLDNTGSAIRCPRIKEIGSIAQVIDFPYVAAIADTTSSTPTSIVFPITITESSLPLKEICPYPPISISKSGPANAIGGCPITYTLTITNNMASNVTGVLVTDTIPVGANYLSGSFLNNNVVSWTIPVISPGEILTNEFSVEATKMITNSDYRVSTSEGYSATGRIPVITAISNLNFLPAVLNNYCGPFFDNFSNPASGWYIGDNSYVRSEYLNGEYRILTKQSGYIYVYRSPGCAREYYKVAVDVRWAENKGAEYGLLLGINSDFDEYYMFLVSADYQDFGLFKRTPSGWEVIEDFRVESGINQGTTVNHLEAVYQNGNLTLKVNNITLGIWSVGTANSSTRTGIVVHPYGDVAISDARFDDFSVETMNNTN